MKENLELEDHEVITEFSFSINEPYEKEIIGYGPYKSGNTYDLLPDFTGDSEAQARATASRLGISVNFVGGNGYVIDQEYPAGKRIDKIRGSVTLTLGGSSRDEEEDDESDNQSDDTSTTKPDSGSGSSKPESGTGGGSESGSGTGENGSGGSGSGGNGSDSGSGGNDGGNTGTDESGDGSTTTPTPPSE